jgi:hypothetical protein
VEHPDYPQATVNQGPQYPKCPYDIEDGVACECMRSLIMGFEGEGHDHKTAIGLALALEAAYRDFSNPVVDALGGFDEFNKLTEDGIGSKEEMEAWYAAHLPLIEYLAERDDELKPYWHQAKYPEYRIPEVITYSTVITRTEDGGYVQVQAPDLPLMLNEDQLLPALEALGLYAVPDWGPMRMGHVTFMVTEYDRSH